MVQQYMIKVYAFLVQANRREFQSLPKQYQVPVAEYLAAEIEE